MNIAIPIIIAVAIIGVAVAVYFASSSKGEGSSATTSSKKGQQATVKEAKKRLKQDPKDPRGLVPLADIFFQDQAWDKALELYNTLIEITPLHPNINLKNVPFRAGVCALQTNDLENAFKNLMIARNDDSESFDVNFYLGQTLFKMNQFDKAIPLLNKAHALSKENSKVHEYLGLSFYEKKDFRKAFPFLKATFDVTPENKKVLFAMADSLYNCGKGDKAIPVFLHLRADPEYGARACLSSGKYHTSKKQIEKAAKDYEIGLKHTGADKDVLCEIKYNFAQLRIGTNSISEALSLLKDIQASVPGYKDVTTLITRYQEMSKNANLQTYLVSGSSDFLALCRKIVSLYYAKSHVKIISIEASPDVVEIQTEIETVKWEDFVVFRFYRGSGAMGEFVVRDFHGRIRDLKAGRGICFTAGIYSSESKNFVEGRPIDLIDKDGLLKVFNNLEHSKPIQS